MDEARCPEETERGHGKNQSDDRVIKMEMCECVRVCVCVWKYESMCEPVSPSMYT